jgi:hypothetical protein
MIEERECWNCGQVYDINEYDCCPECEEYWDNDPDLCSDDYEEVEEEEVEEDFYINDYHLNNNTMNLQTLREPKKEYKGLKSVVTYIQENFKGLESQFTDSLLTEAIKEYASKDKKVAVIYENRLFLIDRHDSKILGHNFSTEPISLSDYYIQPFLGLNIEEDHYLCRRVQIYISDMYFVEDNTEIYKLELQTIENMKQKLIEQQKVELKAKEAEITEKKQYLEDIKKYGTENKREICELKAVEVIRNSKANNKEILEAIKVIC